MLHARTKHVDDESRSYLLSPTASASRTSTASGRGSGDRVTDRPRWLLTCSCGWRRECVSAWSAQAAGKLHQRLGELEVKHAVHIEAPEPPRGSQPTLF